MIHKHHLLSFHSLVSNSRMCVRQGTYLVSSGGSVGAGRYPLTPALSLVGRGAVEYRSPQVMLHMACSLLRSIKCQRLKPSERSEVSVFNKATVLGEFPLFFYCAPKYVLCCTIKTVGKFVIH